MLRNPLLVPDLRELIRDGEQEALRDFFGDHHPAGIAEMIEDMEPAEGDAIIGVLEPRLRAEVISYLDGEHQVRLVEAMPPPEAGELLRFMPHDDRADLVNRLDEDHAAEILRGMAQAEREDIRRLASYEPGTAGSVMTTDYAILPPHLTVREALDQLRREAPERETIYTSYVVDHRRRLIGSVTLLRLIVSRPSTRVEDVMDDSPISVRVDDDQEVVAHTIQRYDLIAIPVVDATDMLVGIITHDDAMDILREEQTEDILAFGGVAAPSPEDVDETYWSGRITSSVRRRIGWLLFLFVGGTIAGLVGDHFEWVNKRFIEINFLAFIPLLIGTGGNAGSQTVGTVIRGLALGEIGNGDALRVLVREWLTGFLLGISLGTIGFFYTWIVRGQSPAFAAAIGLTLLGVCMWANIVGALVPIAVRRFGFDPAVVSAPLISTLVDATGLAIFYVITIVLLIKLA